MDRTKKKHPLSRVRSVWVGWVCVLSLRGSTHGVDSAAAAAGSIFADAVSPDGPAPAGVPVKAVIGGLAGLRVTPDAVDAAPPVPASEFASGEFGAAVGAGAWEFEGDCAGHKSASVYFWCTTSIHYQTHVVKYLKT